MSMTRASYGRIALLAVGLAACAVEPEEDFVTSADQESHSWFRFHWARTSNPFTLGVGDNVDSRWERHLQTALSDWTGSTVVDLTEVAGNGSNCLPTLGGIEACNGDHGDNGWLGIAQVWSTRGLHIAQGVVQVNDYYWETYPYFYDRAWRAYVMCQEVGHTLGLDHVDEDFGNTTQGTCMDYTSPLTAADLHPNAHDYEQLVTIYTHLDRFSTVGSATASQGGAVAASRDDDWGQLVASRGRVSVYVLDKGNGQHVITRVIWAN